MLYILYNVKVSTVSLSTHKAHVTAAQLIIPRCLLNPGILNMTQYSLYLEGPLFLGDLENIVFLCQEK